MSEHNEIVERQRQLLAAEKWAKGVKTLHAHSLTSLWYDDRGNDGSVLDTEYNDGRIQREIRETGETIWFGEELTGDALIDAYGRHGR
jgi:flavin-dependent dehydrogenase